MSNIKNELTYENFEQSIEFILEQHTKKLYTCLPAIIESYDSATKRCSVLPAIKRLFTDGSSRSLPIITDIPVIFPSGGGYTVIMPLKKGDTVLLTFSQRGITNFKKQFQESLPTDSLMDMHDAVAIAGFGSISITPSTSDGCAMQTEDGENSVFIEKDQVKVKKGSNELKINDSEMQATIAGATLKLNSSALTSSVPVMAPSFSGLSGGVANMTSGINMAGQDISDAGDITAGGVNLTTHIHTGDSGGNTGAPKN